MMRVLVTGGRNYGRFEAGRTFERPKKARERARLAEVLTVLSVRVGPFVLIYGAAPGADSLAADWVRGRSGFPAALPFPAAWDDLDAPGAVVKERRDGTKYNALAGLQRNQRMIDEGKPDLVVAFPGGTGTADMIVRAEKAGIKVEIIK